MKTSLVQSNKLIQKIQQNLDNPKRLKQYCVELEDILEYIDQEEKYHYLLFLAQIYSTKLKNFEQADKICNKISKDPRPTVQLEGKLRQAFICSLKQQYEKATILFENASNFTDEKPQLQQIFIEFCDRLFTNSKQGNILYGLKCQSEQKYDEALHYYSKEFKAEIIGNQIQHKYFSAKAISQIISIFPNRNYQNIYGECHDFLRDLHQQKYEQDDLSQIQSLDLKYMSHKSYLTRIVQLLKKKQRESDSIKVNKNNKVKFLEDFQKKKVLAIFKIKRILKTEPQLNSKLRQELERCLKEIFVPKTINYNMINEFIVAENKILTKVNEKMNRTMKKNGIDVLKSFIQQNERQVVKRNRFSNYPNEDYSPTKPRKTSPYYNCGLARPQVVSQNNNEILDIFQGSYMFKINETSSGHVRRYFYIKKEDILRGKLRLYYNSKKQKISNDDHLYEIKSYNRVELGKKTKAFQRSECLGFQQNNCFSIIYENNKTKNFYVPEKADFQKWLKVFKKLESIREKLLQSENTSIKMQAQTKKNIQSEAQSSQKSQSQSKKRFSLFR